METGKVVEWLVKPGDRIAQIVFASLPEVNMSVVDELPDTVRGDGGFGSTGIQ